MKNRNLLKGVALSVVLSVTGCTMGETNQDDISVTRGSGAVEAEQVSTRSYKVAPPEQGIYHAAFPGFGPAEDTVTTRHIDDFANGISGKNLAWAYFSDNWFDGITFPTTDVNTIQRRGVVPFIRVMTRSTWNACSDKRYSLDKIIQGNFDSQLQRYARAAARVNGPLIMEFGTEVNGDWFPWSGSCNGGATTTGYGSPTEADGPERFRDAYRHIIDIFRDQGANNVTWVLHLNSAGGSDAAWNRHAAYYPGDDYIDWLGVSVYGAQDPTTMRTWNPQFRDVMDSAYRAMAAISPSKPIALLEFGVTAHDNKPQWIRSALDDIASGRYSRVKAVSWWHSDWRNDDGTWSRMRLDSSQAVTRAYREGIANPVFVSTARISP